MLKRKFYSTLARWKASHGRECLFVKGARQIGKTFIIDQFGRENYASYISLNFIINKDDSRIFGDNLQADAIFAAISAIHPDFRLIPGNTLIFLDEIQSCPRARTALKSLAIDGRADVIASGSLLGLTFLDDDHKAERSQESIPVGYEKHVAMYPLDFEEYLWAKGYDENAIGFLRESFGRCESVPTVINDKFISLFREYLAIGGMPEVVSTFIGENNFGMAYEAQSKIVDANLDDIARYAAKTDKPKIRACYLSLPEQLARENRKFKYSAVASGGSARKFSSSIDWLRESALSIQCFNTTETHVPLNVYRVGGTFKMYLTDVGILTAMMGFRAKKDILDNTLVGFAKGGLYENAIAEQLVSKGYTPYYYQKSPRQGEIDFVIEHESGTVPIEVKAGRNTSSSFDAMLKRDDVAFGYKFITGNVGRVGKKITLPHYMSMFV